MHDVFGMRLFSLDAQAIGGPLRRAGITGSSKPSEDADRTRHQPPFPPPSLSSSKCPRLPTMATAAPSFRPALPASPRFGNSKPPHRKSRHTKTLALASNPPAQSLLLAKDDLLSLVADQERGVKTQGNPSTRSKIVKAIDALAAVGKDTVTTDASLLSATWRMLWTTEKEQLFIIKNAPVFGTQAGDVLQVIDVEKRSLNNVITFPPSGVFFVRSTIDPAPPQRVNFKFTSAVLRGKDWEFPLPPFGQGWFDSLYIDNDIRVVKDIREDYLVVDRAPYNWKE